MTKIYLILSVVFGVGFSVSSSLAQSETGRPINLRNTGDAVPLPNVINWSELPDLRVGPCLHPTNGTCFSNSVNRFDPSKGTTAGFQGCPRRVECPSGMRHVCSDAHSISVCVDVNLIQDANGVPLGGISYRQCEQRCAARGARMLTNNEWMVAAAGTDRDTCLPRLPARIGCSDSSQCIRRPDYNSTSQMNDLSFNSHLRNPRTQCISATGIRDMVGVLGQHVTNGHARSGRIQFNGGLWAQPVSELFYRTTAHNSTYSDYSTGCRCAVGVMPTGLAVPALGL